MNIFSKLFGKKSDAIDPIKDRIEQSVDIFFSFYEDPARIEEEIEKIAESDEERKMLFLFTPYIFCRLSIPEVEWTDHFVSTNEKGEEIETLFIDSIFYSEMYFAIRNNWDEYIDRDIRKILFHSGDFKAINQMLKNGSKLENLSAIAPKISTR